jgi:hypothetical protein
MGIQDRDYWRERYKELREEEAGPIYVDRQGIASKLQVGLKSWRLPGRGWGPFVWGAVRVVLGCVLALTALRYFLHP